MAGTIKTIIFDFDGTLADTLKAGMAIVNSLADRFGYKKLSDEEIKEMQGKLPRQILKEVGISLWKLPFIARAVRKQLAAQMPLLKPFVEIPELLQALKDRHIRLGILTTGSLDNTKNFLEANHLSGFFDFVYAESNLFGKGRVLMRMLQKHQLEKGISKIWNKTGFKCPNCKVGDVVERKSRGRGKPFYGCNRFPDCTFVMNVKPENEQQLQEAYENWKANPPKPRKIYKRKEKQKA
jgi:phosphoglycolate phosphatase-like HAD superfamily hydrolase